MSSYSLDGSLFEFFIYFFEQETEDRLWQIWINRDVAKSFESFKKEALKQNVQRKMDKHEEQQALNKAESILSMTHLQEIREVDEL